MNKSLGDNLGSDEGNLINVDNAVKILWEWRKYRNQVFWTSVYRYGTLVFFITIAPYLLPDIIGKLGFAIFVFPILACLISVFGAYLMAVQFKLYLLINKKYRFSLGKYDVEDIPDDTPVNRLLRIGIGKIVVLFFLCFAIIGEFFNGLVLFYLAHSALP